MDYKIFTKLLAVRLQKIIKTTVHENQSGFIKGRNNYIITYQTHC